MLTVIVLFFAFIFSRSYLVKNKFAWYIYYYAIMSLFGFFIWIYVIKDDTLLLGCTEGNFDQPIAQFYYQIQFAFYFATFIFIAITDRKSSENGKDMLIHHTITIIVISISRLFNFQRVGFVVLLIHDISDIFLNISRFMRKEHGENDGLTITAFSMFVFSFVTLRLLVFPWFIFARCMWNMTEIQHVIAIACLVVLFLLHCYWFGQIIKIISRLLKKQ